MRTTRTIDVEIRVTPWKPLWWDDDRYGAVRIWLMHDPAFGRWWQCHEWERKDGNRGRVSDGWIHSGRGWSVGSQEPEPGDELPP